MQNPVGTIQVAGCQKVNNQFDLSTIHTTDIIPVDLNSLLFHLEENLSKAYGLKGYKATSLIYSKLASARAKAIHKYCWDESLMFYGDYNFKNTNQPMSPLWLHCILCFSKLQPKKKPYS